MSGMFVFRRRKRQKKVSSLSGIVFTSVSPTQVDVDPVDFERFVPSFRPK